MSKAFKIVITILASHLLGKVRYIFKLRNKYHAISDSHNINTLKKQFIEPYIQETNPANTITACNTLPTIKTKFKDFYKKFIDTKVAVNTHGGNTIFILADAGMGKTALSTMLFENSLRRGHYFPNKVHYLKLGKNTIHSLNLIDSPMRSTIILDALDEDTEAFGRYEDRITDLLQTANKFYRCIITCRTQFFPDSTTQMSNTKEPMKLLGYVQFSKYNCRVFYLSPFDEVQVEEYLKKFFKYKSNSSIKNARKVVDNIGDISSRPLVLSYIDVLADMDTTRINECDIYDKIISFWLNREIRKDAMIKRNIDYAALFLAVNIIAEYMAIRNTVILKKEELLQISKRIEKVSNIKYIDVGGRTLLQKDHDGNYMFAHRVFLEYLVASNIVDMSRIFTKKHVSVTDKMLSFITQKWAYRNARFLTNLLFHDIKISSSDLSGFQFLLCKFVEVNFSGDIKDILFSRCTFNKCTFEVEPDQNAFETCEFDNQPSWKYQPSEDLIHLDSPVILEFNGVVKKTGAE